MPQDCPYLDSVELGNSAQQAKDNSFAACPRLQTFRVYTTTTISKKENGRYKVLLQKRAMNKDSFPGRYDTSSAGHIQAGDEPLESALRELGEELGIKAEASDLDFAGTFRIQYEKEFHGKMFRDNEVAFVFVYQKPVDIADLTIQKEELDGVSWFDLEVRR